MLAYLWSELRHWTVCKLGYHRERVRFHGGSGMKVCGDCGHGRAYRMGANG